MLNRIVIGAAFCATLFLCAPAKAQEPATVQGDPATSSRPASAENQRESNRDAVHVRRHENKDVMKNHRAEMKHADRPKPVARHSHPHGAKPHQAHAKRRKNPNANSDPRKSHKATTGVL